MSSPNNPETTFKSVLQEIYFEYGEEVLRNGHRLYSIFSDMAPQLQKEKRVLKSFLECSGNVRILDVKGRPLAEQKNVIEAIVYKMHEELSITESVARSMCNDFYSVVNGGKTIPSPQGKEKPKEYPPKERESKPRETRKKQKRFPIGLVCIIVLLASAAFGYFNIHIWEPATCTTPKTCSICGRTEGVPLGHQWIEATYNSPKTCSICGKTEGVALQRDWGAPTYSWSDDYSRVTAQRVCIQDSSQIETETVETTSKVTKSATCETKGETTYTTAVFKNTAFTIQSKTVPNIPETGHQWIDATWKSPKTCSVCKRTEGAKKRIYVGDYITFGSYEQDNDLLNGKEPIEWLVLAKENNFVLLISRFGLEYQMYNQFTTDITWEKCTLRAWLNETFTGEAFSAEELKQILMRKVTADKNPEYSTNPGKDVYDKVFVLSIQEAEKYFLSDLARTSKPTKFAFMQRIGKTSSDGLWYWLRSPGSNSNKAAVVNYNGGIWCYGEEVNMECRGVRPALWIELES